MRRFLVCLVLLFVASPAWCGKKVAVGELTVLLHSLQQEKKSDLATDWHDFKANYLPYHGQLFVDPESGIVVRMITIAEFRNTDVVVQEDRRIDYAPVTVGGKSLVLPVRKMVNTEVVPAGDSGAAGRYTTRRTLLTAENRDFKPAGSR